MTANLFEVLTDASLTQRIAADRRTLGGLARHLVLSVQFMSSLGLSFDKAEDGEELQHSAEAIAQAYQRISADLVSAVRSQWTEANLADTVRIAGEEWRNVDSLRFSLMHQAHHRGQMTVLMRQAGLRVPELYGPTYETWLEQGMAPLD